MIRYLIGIMALLLCVFMMACGVEPAPGTDAPTTAATTAVTTIAPVATETMEETTLPETIPEEIPLPEPADGDFVAVKDYIPDIHVELKYATEDNFTGQVIYDFREAYLRYGTVKKLMAVQEELRQQKLSLKIWDAFRPTAAQFVLWQACPDARYVANPNTTFSAHSRGNTLDVTLVDENGEEIQMPTGFDDFSALADRDYSDCEFDAMLNALLLEQTMENHGFSGYKGEWWHFSDTISYPVEETFQPQ